MLILVTSVVRIGTVFLRDAERQGNVVYYY